jgi:NADH:ubiquinone oxidoreductase subunit E
MSPTCECSTDNWEYVRNMSREVLGEDICTFIDDCCREAQPESQLIAILHRVQAKFGWLNAAHLDAVAQLLQVPAAKVSGVASFYHYFRLQPRGKYMINVCLGTACYVKGADRIAQRVISELGITWGETSKDGLFSLEAARCVGTCGLAPVVVIDGQVHGEVSADQVPVILGKYLKKAKG